MSSLLIRRLSAALAVAAAAAVVAVSPAAASSPPTGSVSVTSLTTTPVVNVVGVATDDGTVTFERLSDSPAETGGVLDQGVTVAYQPGGMITSFLLTDPQYGGTSAEGSKTVYAQWQDNDGNWSAVTSASTTLDSQPPIVTASTSAGESWQQTSQFELTTSATDAVTGTVGFRVSNVPYTDVHNELQPGTSFAANTPMPISWDVSAPPVSTGNVIYVQWVDAAGNWSLPQEVTARYDQFPPVATYTAYRLPLGGLATSTTVPVNIQWTDQTEAPLVQNSVDQLAGSGAYTPLYRGKASSYIANVRPGTWYRARIDATDAAGETSPWSAGPGYTTGLIDDTSPRIAYTPGWKLVHSASAVDGTLHCTSKPRAWAKLNFVARGIALIAPKGPGYGQVAVVPNYRRGPVTANTDLSKTTERPRRIVWTIGTSDNSTNALWHGNVLVKAIGTPGRPEVCIDGFATLR